MRCKPLLEQLSLPLVEGNLIGICGDPVPEGPHVVDLLIARQVVEARGAAWGAAEPYGEDTAPYRTFSRKGHDAGRWQEDSVSLPASPG